MGTVEVDSGNMWSNMKSGTMCDAEGEEKMEELRERDWEEEGGGRRRGVGGGEEREEGGRGERE